MACEHCKYTGSIDLCSERHGDYDAPCNMCDGSHRLPVIHFTHTGQFAGLPFCDVVKHLQPEGDKFMHPGYGIMSTENIAKSQIGKYNVRAGIVIGGQKHDICSACAAIWLED